MTTLKNNHPTPPGDNREVVWENWREKRTARLFSCQPDGKKQMSNATRDRLFGTTQNQIAQVNFISTP